MQALLPSAARSASGTLVLPTSLHPEMVESGLFALLVSAAATDVGDTLDVYLQSSVDDGTTYNDFLHFTQVLGNGGAKKFEAAWNGTIVPETELAAPGDAALAAGVKQGPVGPLWRIKWVIVDGNANASFTFAVLAALRRRRR